MFEIRQREVSDQLVLTATRQHIKQAELPERLRELMLATTADAERYGGAAGPHFTIYPDEEYDENDVTIEFCVPIAGDHAADPGVRVEPAHREAYVTLRKSQTVWPTIGEAYQALETWVGTEGVAMAGAPREVYFTNYDAAGADDEVFDVAFPIR